MIPWLAKGYVTDQQMMLQCSLPVTNEPQRTSAGRLVAVLNDSAFFFLKKVKQVATCQTE